VLLLDILLVYDRFTLRNRRSDERYALPFRGAFGVLT
jgi:hypothetical protein